jgi:hypothetical protein
MGVVISSAQYSYAVVITTLEIPVLSLLRVVSDSNLARGMNAYAEWIFFVGSGTIYRELK